MKTWTPPWQKLLDSQDSCWTPIRWRVVNSCEKRWVDGLLARKKGLGRQAKETDYELAR
ncbi:MAG: hypothetical protein HQL62_08600 [Magnetococcales bacterium]|nr:hypothetical protein [Magnetococcales bacterium]